MVRRHGSHRSMASSVMLALMLLANAAAGAALADDGGDAVLLDSRRYDVIAGRFSVFAEFQRRLQAALNECGKPEPAVVPQGKRPTGRIGAGTRLAIKRFMTCPAAVSIPNPSRAGEGVITEQLWRAVMGHQALPTVSDRAHAMILSFEATDFGDAPEWNLCQNGSRKGWLGGLTCYNETDPCSYLTWGPRGATAGAGREIQLILWKVEKQHPDLLKSAFGPEYPNLTRLFRLNAGAKDSCEGPVPLKIFLCAIWMNGARRAIWEKALAQLGEEPAVRKAYDALYALHEFDGAKLREFYDLWSAVGLVPSEVDYAFFLDRATHLGGPPPATDETVRALSRCMKQDSGTVSTNGSARRCLARMQKHETQQDDRLARDVAYYLDAYREGALDEREVQAWAKFVPISAIHNFGLRDDKPFAIAKVGALAALGLDIPDAVSAELTPQEIASCPASVLSPIKRTP